MTFDNNNKEVYNTIFAIDNYKRAYIRCRARNGYIQNHDLILPILKKQFSKKSYTLAALIKRIVLNQFQTPEEYALLTKSCALIESDILTLLTRCSKIKGVKRDKYFKSLYLENQFMIDAFAGKSVLSLFVQNHPILAAILSCLAFFAIPIALLIYSTENQFIKLILQLLVIGILTYTFTTITKHWEKISCVFRAQKIRNQYTILNSIKTENIDQFILDIIKSNSRIR